MFALIDPEPMHDPQPNLPEIRPALHAGCHPTSVAAPSGATVFFYNPYIYVFESYKTIFTWIYGSKNQTRILTFLGRPALPSFKPFHFWRNTRDFEIPGKLWIHGHVIYIQATEFNFISRIRVLHMWFYFPRKPKQQCNPKIHVELHEKQYASKLNIQQNPFAKVVYDKQTHQMRW